jgi:hypothetical protein
MKRLSEFSVVVVNPPWRGAMRSDSFECHVLAVIGNTAALEPINRASTLWLPERLDGALLSFRHDGSLVGFCGTLWLRKAVGDLRYTITDGIHTGLRRATRVDVCAPITLRPAGGANPVEGLTANLSAYDILVACELDAQPGDVVGFSLALPGMDEPLERLARFVVDHNRSVLRRRPQAELELDF